MECNKTKKVYEAKNIVNTFLFSGSPLVGTFKFVAMCWGRFATRAKNARTAQISHWVL